MSRKTMAFLSTLLGASAVTWMAKEWRGASHSRRGMAIGIGAGAFIVAALAMLRAFGLF